MLTFILIVILFFLIGLKLLYFLVPTLFLYKVKVKTVHDVKLESVIPIVKGHWFFGSLFDVARLDNEQLFHYLRQCATKFRQSYLLYIFHYPILNIIDPYYAEKVLNSPIAARKSFLYRPMKDFIHSGLLTSYGKKWQERRKLITPTFHFGILKEFLEIFREETKRVVDVIHKEHLNKPITLDEVVAKFTLDTICETAMGVKLTTAKDGHEYRLNINQLQSILVERSVNPWFYNQFIYKISGMRSECNNYLAKVHHFSSSIISAKRFDFMNKNVHTLLIDNLFQGKKRNAMLDTLLLAQQSGCNLTHADICEEVDTFMFEGYETTSIALKYILLMLAHHQDVQEEVLEEILHEIDNVHTIKIPDLSNLKYLDCVIKETMRLYPSVPMISRGLFEDFILGDVIVPKYCIVNIHIYDLHRNPEYFPDPLTFEPNRFRAENVKERHPFVYIPFSAGLRNCIGQKFAMLEMKMFLVYLLCQFKVLPVTALEAIKFKVGLTLSTYEPIRVEFQKR